MDDEVAQKKNSLKPEQARRIGAYLQELRKRAGLSLHDLDRLSGVPYGYISRLENGKFKQPGEAIARLSKALHTTYEGILSCGATLPRLDNSSRALSIPVLASIPCGLPSLVFQEGGEVLHVAEASLGTHGDLYALRVSGNSLIGDNIQDGDFLIVDRTAPFIDGAIYIVCIDGDCCARHVHQQGNKVILRSSSDLQEIELSELDTQGKVIASNRMQRF